MKKSRGSACSRAFKPERSSGVKLISDAPERKPMRARKGKPCNSLLPDYGHARKEGN